MFTRNFWIAALERAVKTSAQTLAAVLSGNAADLWHLDVRQTAGLAVATFVASVLTSLASAPLGPQDSPSVVDAR